MGAKAQPIRTLDLCPRSQGALRANLFETVGDVLQFSREDLFHFIPIGTTIADDIEWALSQRGLSLLFRSAKWVQDAVWHCRMLGGDEPSLTESFRVRHLLKLGLRRRKILHAERG